MTDRELLAEYAERGSGEAFAELAGRYSGLIYATCLRILGDAHAAEDAVQAVLLLLVRKSKSLNREEGLAGWLVLTARNVALSSLREARRRKAREEEAATMVRTDGPSATWEEIRPHLDAALAGLPPAQRSALVLRYMAGRSRAEAARELGVSEESFSVTASRALDRLRRWFAKRRVEVSSASLCGMLSAEAGSAVLPASLLETLTGLGHGAKAASASATALAEGTLKAMLLAKVKVAAVVLGMVLAVGGGSGILISGLGAKETATNPAAPPQEGAAPPAPVLPSWVPAPGEVAVLTNANGGLANHWRDAVAPNYAPYYAVSSVNDYSGAFKNPHWGAYGCTVFWGGGRGGSNHNAVHIAEYGTSAITFKRVCDPTPWFGTGTAAQTQYDNSVRNANALLNLDYMESTLDGKPGAPNSYGSGDLIGPEFGGAAQGTFLQVISAAVNAANDKGAIAAHSIDFHDTATPSNARTWSRVTDHFLAGGPSWAAPLLTAFVGPQQRVYIQTNNDAGGALRWFDRTSKNYVLGTGTTFSYDLADGFQSGILFHVPSRGLLVCMYPRGGKLEIQWMDVTVAQPTLGGTATLSAAIPVALPWSAGCWCMHNHRILAGNLAGNNGAVAEIAIPAALSGAWPVEIAPFGAGQTIQWEPPASGGNTYKKWHYDEKVRAIVYMRSAARTGDDTVHVYRPRNTALPK